MNDDEIIENGFVVETLTPAQIYFLNSRAKFLWFCAGRGCFAKDTEILMFDGTNKKVQDIQIGDFVMGDDYTQRQVLRLCFGEEPIYRVTLEDGTFFECNESHECVVFDKQTGKTENKQINQLILREHLYYHTKKQGKDKSIALFNFKIKKVKEIDSYYGFTLSGNNRFILGNSMIITKNSGKCLKTGTQVVKSDKSFINVEDIKVGDELLGIDGNPRKVLGTTRGFDNLYTITPYSLDGRPGQSPYTVNSEHILTLLEIDCPAGCCYDFTIDDAKDISIKQLISEKEKSYNTDYYYTFKYDPEKKEITNTANFRILEDGFGEYAGFELDGDGRFFLADYTVTHNSTVGARYVYRKVIQEPKSIGMICANAYKQLNSATLPPVLEYFRKRGLQFVTNKKPPESWIKDSTFYTDDYDGILVTETGAHILLRSLDKYDFIRGVNLGWAWIDEISSSSLEAWNVVIGALRDPNCSEREIRVTGTPYGDNWTWREFKKKWDKDPNIAKDYDMVFMSSRENPFLPKDFLDTMLNSYDRRTALQEVDGRILLDQSSNTYYEYNSSLHERMVVEYDPNRPIMMCWDFNASKDAPMSCVLAQQHNYANGVPFVQVIDEIVIYQGNTPKVCEEFKKRYPNHPGGLYIYGDATARSRGASVGINDYLMMKSYLEDSYNIEFFVPKSNMSETNRIAAVNTMLLNSRGLVRLFVNPTCVELIKDFMEVKPDSNQKINKRDQARTHTSDALGYYIAREFPIYHEQEHSDNPNKVQVYNFTNF